MTLQIIERNFTICKVADYSEINPGSPFVFTAATDQENSLVCPTELTPENVTAREDGWKALRIEGILDFSLVGILSRISTILAENGIGIFAVSTFNTDYILLKENNLENAVKVLAEAGYTVSKQ